MSSYFHQAVHQAKQNSIKQAWKAFALVVAKHTASPFPNPEKFALDAVQALDVMIEQAQVTGGTTPSAYHQLGVDALRETRTEFLSQTKAMQRTSKPTKQRCTLEASP